MRKIIDITDGPSAEELFLALRLGKKESRTTPFVFYFQNESKHYETIERKMRVGGIIADEENDQDSWKIHTSIPETWVLGKKSRPYFIYDVIAEYSTQTKKGKIVIDNPQIIE